MAQDAPVGVAWYMCVPNCAKGWRRVVRAALARGQVEVPERAARSWTLGNAIAADNAGWARARAATVPHGVWLAGCVRSPGMLRELAGAPWNAFRLVARLLNTAVRADNGAVVRELGTAPFWDADFEGWVRAHAQALTAHRTTAATGVLALAPFSVLQQDHHSLHRQVLIATGDDPAVLDTTGFVRPRHWTATAPSDGCWVALTTAVRHDAPGTADAVQDWLRRHPPAVARKFARAVQGGGARCVGPLLAPGTRCDGWICARDVVGRHVAGRRRCRVLGAARCPAAAARAHGPVRS